MPMILFDHGNHKIKRTVVQIVVGVNKGWI